MANLLEQIRSNGPTVLLTVQTIGGTYNSQKIYLTVCGPLGFRQKQLTKQKLLMSPF